MAYIAPKDYAADPEIVAKILRTVSGELELSWMKRVGEPAAFRPSQPARGLTLDDINQGGYAPDKLPEVIRHNFSMAPRGALLPPGLPSLGYRVNRKSDVWADVAPQLFGRRRQRVAARSAADVPPQRADRRIVAEPAGAVLLERHAGARERPHRSRILE